MADSSEHIVRIIVQGLNRLGNLVNEVTGEQEKMTKAQERHTKSVKDTERSVEDLKKEYKKFVAEVKAGEKDYDSARAGLARFAAEFDKFSKRRPIGSPASEELNRIGIAAKRLSDQLKVAHEAERKLAEQDMKDRVRREEERQALTARTLREELRAEEQGVKNRRALMDELLDAVRQDNEERIAFNRELTRREVEEERRRTQARIDESTRAARETADVSRRQDVQAAAPTLRQRIGRLFGRDEGSPRRFVQDLDGITKGSNNAERGVSRLDRVLERLHGSADRAGFSVARVDNNLRGLLVIGVVAFSQQLISALISLGATLFSVGAAAVQAGAAIGGAMVAAAGQAVPAIGLLIAAFGRIGAVFDAVQLFNKQATRSGRDQAAAADAQAAAADRVASAQEGVASASQRVRDATEALTRAREDALRNIQDLNLAERAASQGGFQAETALRRAIAGGDVGALEGLRVQRDEAALRARRARADAGQARAQGVEGSDQVRQAIRTLDDANTGLRRARRELEAANRAAAKAAEGTTAADDALKEALAQLTPAELALYASIKRIQERFKVLFRPITDVIVRAFTDATDRVRVVMADPRVLGPLRDIAEAIASSIRRITRELTNERSLNFFKFMAREAARNIPLLTDMGIRINRIFSVIARATSPALRRFLQFFDDLIKKGDKATDSKSGLSRLQRFFLRGEEMAESFIKLTGAVIGLFAALAGAGAADTGQSAIDQLTDQIKKATDWVNDNRDKVRQFFKDSLDAAKAIAVTLFSVARAATSVFDSKSVQDFARAFNDVLLPAFTVAIEALGTFTHLFVQILDLPVVSQFTKFALATGFIFKAFSVLGKLLGPFSVGIVRLLGDIPLLGRLFRGLAIAIRFSAAVLSGPWGLAIASVVAGIVFLDRKFHFIRPTIHFLGELFKNVFGAIAHAVSSAAPVVVHFLGDVIGGAFGILKSTVTGFADTFLGAITTMLGGISSLASAASSIPVLGKAFKGVSDFIDGARDKIDGYRESIRAMGEEHDKAPSKVERIQTEVNRLSRRLSTLKEGSDEYRETAIRLRHRQDDLNVAMAEAETQGKRGARGPRALGNSARSAASAVDDANKTIVGSYNQIAKQLGGLKPLKYNSTIGRVATGPDSISDTPPVPLARAMGGWIGRSYGPQGPDNRHIVVGDREAVLNLPQQGPVEEGLALRSMLLGGPGSLTDLFRQFGGAFAAGGMVAGRGIDLKGASSSLMRYAIDAARYHLSVSSGLRPGATTSSGNTSNHALGRAIDLAGSAKDMLRFALHAASSYGRRLAELIHTPMRFGIKAGRRVPLSFWGATVNADHFDHVHLAAGDGGPAGGVGGAADIARRRIRGPAGALRDLTQRAVDRVRRAANDRLGDSFSVDPEPGGRGRVAGVNAAQIRRWIIAGLQLARQRVTQGAISTLFGRIMQESGGDPRAINLTDVNARRGDPSRGILQTIMSTFRRYMVRGHGNVYNPVDNIAAAVRYMLSRYGRLVGAGPGGYQTGGFTGGTAVRRAYQTPAIFNTSFRGVLEEIRNAQAVTARLLTRAPQFFRDFGRSVGQIVDDGGLLDQARDAVTKEVNRVALRIKQATFLVTKSGVVLQRLSQQQLDLLQPAAIDEQREMLQDVRRAAQRSLSDVNRRLAIIRRGGVTDKERKAYETLVAAQRKLLTQISDLDQSIADAVEARFNAQVQVLQDAIDEVNKQAQRTLTRADLADRVATVVQGLGPAFDQTAFALRGSALQARSSALITQRDRLSQAAQIAVALGKNDIAQDLIAQVEELNVALFENAAAIRSNTVAARQARIDAITNRGSFLGGVFGNLTSLLQTAGGTDAGRQIDLNRQARGVLEQTSEALRQQLFEITGIDLTRLGTTQLVDRLSGLNFDAIESGLTVEQRAQFEGLINAIIDNASAQEQNTQALRELGQTVEQSFSSTAWQLFRQAIFTGSGGLLPQYQVPAMASGGTLLSDGLLYGHRGEQVVPARVARDQPWSGGDTNNIYITSPTEVADPDHIARTLSFQRSLRRATRA